MLYFKQYATAGQGTPLFDNAATGTQIINTIPSASAPAQAWQARAESQFDEFRSDVQGGKLPQVSWICAPAGYTETGRDPGHRVRYVAWRPYRHRDGSPLLGDARPDD
jgi:phospholipase C